MHHTSKVLHRTLRRLLLVQGVLVAAVAIGFGALSGAGAVPAALFGGGIALLNTLISAERLHRATAVAGQNPSGGMGHLYAGAIVRFVATPALVVLGILALSLDAVALLAGFAVAQLGYLFNNVHTGPARSDG